MTVNLQIINWMLLTRSDLLKQSFFFFSQRLKEGYFLKDFELKAAFLHIFHRGPFSEFWKFTFLIKMSGFIKSEYNFINSEKSYGVQEREAASRPWLQNWLTVSSGFHGALC